jgi:hypothetical protein
MAGFPRRVFDPSYCGLIDAILRPLTINWIFTTFFGMTCSGWLSNQIRSSVLWIGCPEKKQNWTVINLLTRQQFYAFGDKFMSSFA